jgi:protoporphyrinogen oxidase
MVRLLGDNVHKLRRSNKILHDGRLVKYPFENELSALAENDRQHCLRTFLSNPYADYAPQNMLQFFLATFGEGITSLYLRPYNEKIWKFDPAFMDTQMVERIPKPPAEDIIRSAEGEPTEGYRHQLYFYYPKAGGIQTLVEGFCRKLGDNVSLATGAGVRRVRRAAGRWEVATADGRRRHYDRLVSTIPLPELIAVLGPGVPRRVVEATQRLKFNSMAVCVLRVRRDRLGNNFALLVPDRRVPFHRVAKLNFLAPPSTDDGGSTLSAEVTYRAEDPVDQMRDDELAEKVTRGLGLLGLIDPGREVLAQEVFRVRYAYVIYDLAHRRNVQVVRDYCEQRLGITLHGRFGEFEYLNMDGVIRRSLERGQQLTRLLTAQAG